MCRYWDWTLDWSDLAASPIWSNTTGFGGDGGGLKPGPYDDGSSCVTDGPFRDMKLRYMNSTVLPHCLSRGFIRYEDRSNGSISGDHVKPSMIERLLKEQHYWDFREKMEYVVHNAIHWGLRGDFAQWSSANGMFRLQNGRLLDD